MVNLCVNCKYLNYGDGCNDPLNEYNHICLHEASKTKIINHITGKDESRYKFIIQNKLNQEGTCVLFEAGNNVVKGYIENKKNKKPFWKIWG